MRCVGWFSLHVGPTASEDRPLCTGCTDLDATSKLVYLPGQYHKIWCAHVRGHKAGFSSQRTWLWGMANAIKYRPNSCRFCSRRNCQAARVVRRDEMCGPVKAILKWLVAAHLTGPDMLEPGPISVRKALLWQISSSLPLMDTERNNSTPPFIASARSQTSPDPPVI
jgi:hypothetical protein